MTHSQSKAHIIVILYTGLALVPTEISTGVQKSGTAGGVSSEGCAVPIPYLHHPQAGPHQIEMLLSWKRKGLP
ncbi:hypothetical protein DPMN_128772 [Dreissena polymorpha]|uniref:Secreted protein n=1 Tax=Dreissena polymorpha TaxID=45954 RepID=A0A9D4H4K2_DREPO|nr:hypothetical protein DPMN_128772 [Dreissena polymorpha]